MFESCLASGIHFMNYVLIHYVPWKIFVDKETKLWGLKSICFRNHKWTVLFPEITLFFEDFRTLCVVFRPLCCQLNSTNSIWRHDYIYNTFALSFVERNCDTYVRHTSSILWTTLELNISGAIEGSRFLLLTFFWKIWWKHFFLFARFSI